MRPYETPEMQEKLNIIKTGVLHVVPDTEAIYLFGSYAYGKPHKDSDLDIYVVVPDSVEAHPLDIAVEIRRELRKDLLFPLDLIVKNSTGYALRKSGPTLDKVIAVRGVRVYG
ncbi:MAG: nucleotidyltransferase domain-containing protein [Peptococcaceae bacterium]|jgi:predicted nucleotidyltransferase|nr:nucleotidyltransferase domain-containing protein [Peptococcaceae bacterium]